MRTSILLALVVLFSGCSGNRGIVRVELPGGYVYTETSYQDNQIISPLINGNYVRAHIVDYKYNKDFIVVCQAPDYHWYKMAIIGEIMRADTLEHTGSLNTDKLEKEAENILKSDTTYTRVFRNKTNYWVMDIKNKKEYGPLSESEYLVIRQQMHIPKFLKLME